MASAELPPGTCPTDLFLKNQNCSTQIDTLYPTRDMTEHAEKTEIKVIKALAHVITMESIRNSGK